MSKGSKHPRRYCDHCGSRVPIESGVCEQRPDLHERTPAAKVSWEESGKTVTSILPQVCLKRVTS